MSLLSQFKECSWISLAVPCRGCLGPLDPAAEAGLCGRCWSGLQALPADRCPRCALIHEEGVPCGDPTPWTFGDALWDYHGGRPALGPLLVPAAKSREHGWRRTLLERVAHTPLPAFTAACTLITAAPPTPWRHLVQGGDLAEAAARQWAGRLGLPFRRLLRKPWRGRRQAGRTATERRRLPAGALTLCDSPPLAGEILLLVDDVWTTGATLNRAARLLLRAGAAEIRVLTLFRAET